MNGHRWKAGSVCPGMVVEHDYYASKCGLWLVSVERSERHVVVREGVGVTVADIGRCAAGMCVTSRRIIAISSVRLIVTTRLRGESSPLLLSV